jgi:hypothetical protein
VIQACASTTATPSPQQDPSHYGNDPNPHHHDPPTHQHPQPLSGSSLLLLLLPLLTPAPPTLGQMPSQQCSHINCSYTSFPCSRPPQDQLVAVNGTWLEGVGYDRAVEAIRAASGARPLTLTFRRNTSLVVLPPPPQPAPPSS